MSPRGDNIATGGIEFAAPNEPNAKPVRNGAIFPLHAAADKAWLQWVPPIRMPADKQPSAS